MTYVFQVGDYIKFERIYVSAKDVGHRTDHATGRAIVVPARHAQVLPQSGQGQIVRIAKSAKKMEVPGPRGGKKIERIWTAQVAAGPVLKTVSAVLNEATLAAKQEGLFQMDAVEQSGSGMYRQDAKGGA